jgi:dephospho-CoA kinase
MRIVSDDLRSVYHPAYLAEQAYLQAKQQEKNAVIESIRAVGEVQLLQQDKDFFLLAVDADQKLRYERAMQRGNETDYVSFEKFQEQEALEMRNTDPTRGNIAACMAMANGMVHNDGDRASLYQQLERLTW